MSSEEEVEDEEDQDEDEEEDEEEEGTSDDGEGECSAADKTTSWEVGGCKKSLPSSIQLELMRGCEKGRVT